jgi:hypothetical protein
MARRGKLSIIYPAQACEPEVAAKLNEWISGIARVYACRALHVVEVDRYFSVKWLHFSGKALGALGISKNTTTIPPFIPSRVLRERRFLLRGPWAPYEDKPERYRLHIWQTSSSNLQRIAARVAPDVALVWYGGGSATEGQAGFMAIGLVWRGFGDRGAGRLYGLHSLERCKILVLVRRAPAWR